MSVNFWLGVWILLVPALVLVSIASAVRICLLLFPDEQSARTLGAVPETPVRIERERFARTPTPSRPG